jgi:putative ABC transport system ATP-binding protein
METRMYQGVTTLAAPAGQMPEPAVVQIRNLKHYFTHGENAKPSLDVEKLDVLAGEIVIMTGPSGSGKTTLLTLIGGLRTIQEGEVDVLSRSLTGLKPQELVAVRRDLGFIFQAHNLFSSLTAYQNVCMSLQLHGWSRPAMHARAVEMLTALGLNERIYYKPGSLSGGQRQRVAIARALANRPRLILADEPTAALDAKSSQDVIDHLQQMARTERTAILLVTHDSRILNIADRIVNMVDGKIVSDVYVDYTLTICTFLKKCNLFAGMTPDALTRLAEKMGTERFTAGSTVIRQGDQITERDKFFLIRRGSVDVIAEDPVTHAKRHITTLTEGDHFGEIAMVTGGQRTAHVIARDEVETWTLDKITFDAALASSASFKEQIQKVLFQRQ